MVGAEIHDSGLLGGALSLLLGTRRARQAAHSGESCFAGCLSEQHMHAQVLFRDGPFT